MSHRELCRTLLFDGLAGGLILVFLVVGSYAVSTVAPDLPGGPVLWAAVALACLMAGTVLMFVGLCRDAATGDADESRRRDESSSKGTDRPTFGLAVREVAPTGRASAFDRVGAPVRNRGDQA